MVAVLAVNPVVDWSDDQRSWEALVTDVALGNEHALAQLYDQTNRIVYGLALRIVKDPSSAEDIALEVYLQVWRTAGSYNPQRGSVTAWLVTLVRSRAIDWLRARKSRRSELEQDMDQVADLRDPRPSPEHHTVQAGRARIVKDAMAKLSPDQVQAVELAYFSGLSHSEISQRTGLPLGTVKTRIRLGMAHLKEMLEPYAEGL